MRAVNLIPNDQRRGGPGSPTRSGGAVYFALGGLAAAVVLVALSVLAGNGVNDKRAELSKLTGEAQAAQAEAASLKPYRDFAQLSATRTQTVSSLAATRFDWDGVLRQLARVLPENVSLTSVVGTMNSTVQLQDKSGSGGSSTIRSAKPDVPALEIVGCTESQAEVSHVMARLRLIDGVDRVTLSASEKAQATASAGGATAGGSGGSTDCRQGSSRYPQFELVVFFAPAASAAAPGSAAPVSQGASR